jgi:ribosomal protein L37AE/L43A
MSITGKIRKVAGILMEADDMVRLTKKCPFCGATTLYRRIRKGGYHCNKCKQSFDHPKVEKVGRVV